MTRIDTEGKQGRVKAFIDELRKASPDFDKDLADVYNTAMRNDRKAWGMSMLKILRTGYKAGERSSIVNEG